MNSELNLQPVLMNYKWKTSMIRCIYPNQNCAFEKLDLHKNDRWVNFSLSCFRWAPSRIHLRAFEWKQMENFQQFWNISVQNKKTTRSKEWKNISSGLVYSQWPKSETGRGFVLIAQFTENIYLRNLQEVMSLRKRSSAIVKTFVFISDWYSWQKAK